MNFKDALKDFTIFSLNITNEDAESFRNEAVIEGIKDWSELDTIDTIKQWFEEQQDQCLMTIEEISLMDCDGWSYNEIKGVLEHKSGEFFYIQGLRIKNTMKREVVGGWDQPIVTQVGYNGGLLGLLRKKINSIPYYLVEAKAEPGNPDKVQISPTLQATFSNLKRAHGGNKPKFSEFFENPGYLNSKVLFDQWMSEDGGRLYLKKNKGMIVEISNNTVLPGMPSSFKWLSLYQIKYLIKENSWVGPHIRSIISHL
jgi:dTDP-4-dehydro-6-deoxy-alpha-D-glucopyranose 2,3-dehydratase